MSDSASARPKLADITRALARAADRVTIGSGVGLDAAVAETARATLTELETYIPGLAEPPNAEAARSFTRACEDSLDRGDEREALAYALRGLSCSPHDPNLCYLAGTACIELGGLETALRFLYHTLWIHPGHRAARKDIEALTAFLEDDNAEAA